MDVIVIVIVMCGLLDSGADTNSTIECCGESFTRFWSVLKARECAVFGVAWSS